MYDASSRPNIFFGGFIMRSRILGFVLLIIATSVAAAQDQKLTGEQIIERHLEAVGGRAAIAKIKSRIALGTIKKESEPEAQMAILSELPDRFVFFCAFRDYDLHMIYDGKKPI